MVRAGKAVLKNAEKTVEIFEFDRAFGGLVLGCDEAGRGPLAGPVVCAACAMPTGKGQLIDGIYDSKALSEKKRGSLYDQIIATAYAYSISIINEAQIDKTNILIATKNGMVNAICGLINLHLENIKNKHTLHGKTPIIVLIDAVKLNLGLDNPELIQHSIIRGDQKSYNIAAASIIAKTVRDELMFKFDAWYPQYSFKSNKGYGTKKHIEAIKELGACKIHRQSFIRSLKNLN